MNDHVAKEIRMALERRVYEAWQALCEASCSERPEAENHLKAAEADLRAFEDGRKDAKTGVKSILNAQAYID